MTDQDGGLMGIFSPINHFFIAVEKKYYLFIENKNLLSKIEALVLQIYKNYCVVQNKTGKTKESVSIAMNKHPVHTLYTYYINIIFASNKALGAAYGIIMILSSYNDELLTKTSIMPMDYDVGVSRARLQYCP